MVINKNKPLATVPFNGTGCHLESRHFKTWTKDYVEKKLLTVTLTVKQF